jgi:hypothetical protein
MRAQHATLIAFFFCAWPTVSVAGPIEFSLMPTGLWTPPGSSGISTGLTPINPLNVNYTFDPITGTPTAISVVAYDPSRVPPPPSNPSGIAHWNNAGPFKVALHLTDTASGDFADFTFKGHIHMFNNGPRAKWTGDVYFQFLDDTAITLGDHTYFIWGINDKDAGPATVLVRVELNTLPASPAHAPEPATVLLATLGLAPLALRRVWRKPREPGAP